MALEARSPRPGRQCGWVLEKALLLAGRQLSSSCALVRWTQMPSWGPQSRDLTTFQRPHEGFNIRIRERGAQKHSVHSLSFIRTQSCPFTCVFSRTCLCYQGTGSTCNRDLTAHRGKSHDSATSRKRLSPPALGHVHKRLSIARG